MLLLVKVYRMQDNANLNLPTLPDTLRRTLSLNYKGPTLTISANLSKREEKEKKPTRTFLVFVSQKPPDS